MNGGVIKTKTRKQYPEIHRRIRTKNREAKEI